MIKQEFNQNQILEFNQNQIYILSTLMRPDLSTARKRGKKMINQSNDIAEMPTMNFLISKLIKFLIT